MTEQGHEVGRVVAWNPDRERFYSDEELTGLGQDAGFKSARVVRRDLEGFARESGIPEEHVELFKGQGAPFLLASKE